MVVAGSHCSVFTIQLRFPVKEYQRSGTDQQSQADLIHSLPIGNLLAVLAYHIDGWLPDVIIEAELKQN